MNPLAARPHDFVVGNFFGEIRNLLTAGEKIGCRDNDVAFRNENAVGSAIVSDEDIAASEILLGDICHVVSVYTARRPRRGIVHSHYAHPQLEGASSDIKRSYNQHVYFDSPRAITIDSAFCRIEFAGPAPGESAAAAEILAPILAPAAAATIPVRHS